MASSSLESSILANNSSSPTTTSSTTTNFSRRSATYTASTFAAFEYGSNYEYHGSYNTKGDEENNDGAENDEESPPSSRITFDDLDELLEGLNEEELKELSIIDPDDSSIPPSMRCLYHCDKIPSGEKINRSSLRKLLKENSINAPDIEDIVPFIPGVKRGKPYVPKIRPSDSQTTTCDFDNEEDDDDNFQSKISDEDLEMAAFLDQAPDIDLKEIADILGIMYQNDCSAEILKSFPDEPPIDDIDFGTIIDQIESNDEYLNQVNLNNVQHFETHQWIRLFKALEEKNTVVEEFSAANCNLKDHLTTNIAQALAANGNLKKFTLDSNQLSGPSLIQIMKAIIKQGSLQELRINNQLICKKLGHRVESEIAALVEKCPQLLKLGATFEFRAPLHRVALQLQRNLTNSKKSILAQQSSLNYNKSTIS